ncbi:MAG: hypothetical protein AUG51_07325 [Acidobacteria bacterium 13_1_20CM_3_53_8]|nr:MAG: hypothetical protein AUG51_07325 [Acidobacteria bacterium 13_1_20CM_3_53_8]
MDRGFSFFVGGIEDAMIAALAEQAAEYSGDIAPYAGEFGDEKKLREAIDSLTPRFPLFLVGYGSGHDKRETQLFPEHGSPWVKRHDCTFIVILADNDARGEEQQRRGATGIYRMIDDVHAALEGRQFVALIGEGEEQERVILNPGEFIATDVEHIVHFADMTAYAVPFETYFRYLTPDRREPGLDIEAIQFEIDLTNRHRVIPGDAPGVHVR